MSARSGFALAIALAIVLGAWLRFHGLGAQVVQDDEWHAIHKLMGSGYADIFRSFGQADHSIPLTLLYKAMAETVGLTEINMRIVQVLAGIALIALAAALAWYVTASRAAVMLFAFLVAGAPFLVLYSRIARPYAITTLLVTGVLALLWRWRECRGLGLGALACALTALAAWLHPISAVFPAVAMLAILAEDLRARKDIRAIVLLALAAAAAIAAPLAVPLMNDAQALTAKAGGSFPGGYTVWRMSSLFAGGLPDAVTAILVAIAAFGAVRLVRSQPALGMYLAALAVVPVALFMLVGAAWAHQGHTFARLRLPGAAHLSPVAFDRRRRSRAGCDAAGIATRPRWPWRWWPWRIPRGEPRDPPGGDTRPLVQPRVPPVRLRRTAQRRDDSIPRLRRAALLQGARQAARRQRTGHRGAVHLRSPGELARVLPPLPPAARAHRHAP
jgi:hypothetical protein